MTEAQMEKAIKDWDELFAVERSLSGVRYAELEDNPIESGFELVHPCVIHEHSFGEIDPGGLCDANSESMHVGIDCLESLLDQHIWRSFRVASR